jgi:membrane protein required for colicin V production
VNWLDVVLGLIVLASIAGSIRKGLTREIIGLVSTVLALVLAIWFYSSAGLWLQPYVSTKAVANFLGFVLVLVGVLAAGSLVSWLAGKMLKMSGLSIVDRLLGGVFGLVKGLIISVAIVTAIVAFAPGVAEGTAPAAVAESRIAPYVIDAGHVLAAIAPRELKDLFDKHYDAVRKLWKEAAGKKIA